MTFLPKYTDGKRAITAFNQKLLGTESDTSTQILNLVECIFSVGM